MRKRDFIRENRKTIDDIIQKQIGKSEKLNDREREMWIQNYEPLYNWAKRHQLSF